MGLSFTFDFAATKAALLYLASQDLPQFDKYRASKLNSWPTVSIFYDLAGRSLGTAIARCRMAQPRTESFAYWTALRE